MISFILSFLLWSLLAYANHWFVHTKWAPKWLVAIHQLHHDRTYNHAYKFDWKELFFWFGSVKESFGVIAGITVPCIIACFLFDCWWLLLVHYVYEAICSDLLVEHNKRLKGRVADFFGVGRYHLAHHVDPTINHAVGLSFWDTLFNTREK